MTLIRGAVFVLLSFALASGSVLAQSNVSTQGFGYPPGQMSTASMGAAGAMSEFDPISPINPAALVDWGPHAGIHFQTDPEFRTVTSPGGIDHTTTIRFPLLVAAVPIRQDLVAGVSFSTLLDRSWQTITTDTISVGDTLVQAQNSFRSTGGIEDLAISVGYGPTASVSFGGGLHFYTGQDQVTIIQTFPGSGVSSTAPYTQADLYTYQGFAVSGGVELRPGQNLSLALSGRYGGQLALRRRDTTQTTSSVPPRLGGALRWDGITGLQFGFGVDWEGWSKMGSLGMPGLGAHDSYTYSVGVNAVGPKFGGDQGVTLHLGAATRTLPFEAVNTVVRENLITAGLGLPLSFQRAQVDFALQRALRSAPPGYSENAWLLSIGLTIRP
jgi:hypothetical protein